MFIDSRQNRAITYLGAGPTDSKFRKKNFSRSPYFPSLIDSKSSLVCLGMELLIWKSYRNFVESNPKSSLLNQIFGSII